MIGPVSTPWWRSSGVDEKFIPVSAPDISPAEISRVTKVLSDGWVSGEAPIVAEFEAALAQYTGRQHAVAVNSGTSALDIAVAALELGDGDEVVLPAFTIISCLNEVLRSGAKPVFIEVEADTWNATAKSVEHALTEQTKAVILPHLYGLPAEIEQIELLCNSRGVTLIEDAAEGLGISVGGRPVGSFGSMSTLSFYANKLITSGEGGMVLTDDPILADTLRQGRNLGFIPPRRFIHKSLGWNYRMPALSAALGIAQMERVDDLLNNQRERGVHYQELLRDVPYIQLPLDNHEGTENVYWVFGFVLDAMLELNAETFMEELQHRGIGSRPFFYPLHQQPVLQKFGWGDHLQLPVSENLGERGLYIPSLGTSATDRTRVAQAVADIVKKHS